MKIAIVAPPSDPHCPDPEHSGWKVWKDGYQGVAPSRRQRYRCVNPKNRDEWHRFSPPVFRVEAPAQHCSGCHQDLPVNAGPIIAGCYHYYAEVIADTLRSVATGLTYTDASVEARKKLVKAELTRAELKGEKPSEEITGKQPLRHGQLAADWVEVFSQVVLTPPIEWAPVLLLDSTDF